MRPVSDDAAGHYRRSMRAIPTQPTLRMSDARHTPESLTDRRHCIADEFEIISIATSPAHSGLAAALLKALKSLMSGYRRMWLVTTSDNLDVSVSSTAGASFCGWRPGAVNHARDTAQADDTSERYERHSAPR